MFVLPLFFHLTPLPPLPAYCGAGSEGDGECEIVDFRLFNLISKISRIS